MNNPYAAPAADVSAPASDDGRYQPRLFAWTGRIGRLRYLAYAMAVPFLVAFPLGILAAFLGSGAAAMAVNVLSVIAMLAVGLVAARRRLHDLGHSGWLSLLMLIPFVNFLFGLYLVFGAGADGANEYGPAPVADSGWVIAGACVLPFVFVIGILAAIAIPAYQNYVQRAASARVDARP